MRQPLPPLTHLAALVAAAVLSCGCEQPEMGRLPGGPQPAPAPLTSGGFELAPEDLPAGRDTLRFGVAPTVGPEVAAQEFGPISDFLSGALGVPVELVIAESYDDLIEQVAEQRVELALIPPLAYVLARERHDDLRLLMSMISQGRTHYSAFILVPMDAEAGSLEDLRGRRVAFVDRSSTSGNLLPAAALRSQGIDPEEDFAELHYAGGHVRAIRMLARGEVDAVATATGMLETARRTIGDQHPEEQRALSQLRILYKAGEVPYDALCETGVLPESALPKIEGAFLSMNTRNPDARAALRSSHGITGWAPAEDAFYDDIRDVYRSERPGHPPTLEAP